MIAAGAALGLSLPASGAPPSVGDKRGEATSIMAQIASLDSDLNRAVESYDGARAHLADTEQAIRSNGSALAIANHNLRRARQNVARHLVDLYTGDPRPGAIEVILGAKSLDDLMTRVDAADAVAAQDAFVVRQVTTFRSEVTAHQISLLRARKRAAELLVQTSTRKRQIESRIGSRQQLLELVKGQMARLQAAERVRQAQLAAAVRARLVASPVVAATAGETPVTTETPATADPVAAPPSRYGGAVAIAMRYLGVPYTWGGASPSTGFDCSGFTMYVYAQLGVSLPHYTGDQWQLGTAVARTDLQPGDLVFFDAFGHEGIYIGNNQFIHAPHTGDVVKISSITGWYADRYMGARRLT